MADAPTRSAPRLALLVGAWWLAAVVAVVVAACGPARGRGDAGTAIPPLPPTLAATGLYADPATREIAADVMAFAPQYPLWSDGAAKKRWIRLPPGASIDGSDPDAWRFPIGTRLWKEFTFGRRVETRFLERLPDGTWRFA